MLFYYSNMFDINFTQMLNKIDLTYFREQCLSTIVLYKMPLISYQSGRCVREYGIYECTECGITRCGGGRFKHTRECSSVGYDGVCYCFGDNEKWKFCSLDNVDVPSDIVITKAKLCPRKIIHFKKNVENRQVLPFIDSVLLGLCLPFTRREVSRKSLYLPPPQNRIMSRMFPHLTHLSVSHSSHPNELEREKMK